jgi:hypothetical protein
MDFHDAGARLLDFLVEESSSARAFLAGMIRWLRAKKICTLATKTTDHNPIIGALRSFGVILREASDSSVAVYAPPSNGVHRLVLNESNWFMTQADRDV